MLWQQWLGRQRLPVDHPDSHHHLLVLRRQRQQLRLQLRLQQQLRVQRRLLLSRLRTVERQERGLRPRSALSEARTGRTAPPR